MRAVRVKCREHNEHGSVMEKEIIFHHDTKENIVAQVVDLAIVVHGKPKPLTRKDGKIAIMFESTTAMVVIESIDYFSVAEALVSDMAGFTPGTLAVSLVEALNEESPL